MEENRSIVSFEEVLNSDSDDIWDIFFPYLAEKKEKIQRLEHNEHAKARRHLRFLTM